jgi:hypothetical protein
MIDAQNQGFGLVGVAPEATIGMYRVFGCSENSGDDVIMAAMQQAAEDGVDLITISLGSLSYWEQASPYVSLAESIVESGVAIIAALGNDGDLGPYAVSAPGLAPEVLAVGSVENEVYPTVYKAQNNIGGSLEYIRFFLSLLISRSLFSKPAAVWTSLSQTYKLEAATPESGQLRRMQSQMEQIQRY